MVIDLRRKDDEDRLRSSRTLGRRASSQDIGRNADGTRGAGASSIDPSDANLIGNSSMGNVYRVSDDILAGAYYQKYDNTKHLEGQQERYREDGAPIKTVNFKQDYVVLIRKKLYYAANAVNNGDVKYADLKDANVDQGHYLRTYKVDNFISANTSITVMGQPGQCSLQIKGGERVFCYEHTSAQDGGNPTVAQMVSDEWPLLSAQLVNDSANAGYTNSQLNTGATASSARAAQEAVRDANGGLWNREFNDMEETTSGNRVRDIGRQTQVSAVTGESAMDTGQAEVTYHDEQVGRDITIHLDKEEELVQQQILNGPPSDWKFAEKCDWEEMDEVWVFGKSNFERGADGDFKMNQIFFGYIDSVQWSYTSGKTNGCMISIQASDQLKILSLSYVTQTPSLAMGASIGGQGIDIRYGFQDAKAFGTFVLFDPYEAMRATKGASMGADGTKPQADQANNTSYACFAYTNVFAGMTAEEIIRELCADAGVPLWYMNSRIEPIGWPPYVMKIKQFTGDMLFQMSTQKRLDVCREVARKLQIEFFADEAGNIVLKCPSYALGVNTLAANNMGYTELEGGMLDQLSVYQVTSSYWGVNEENPVSGVDTTPTGKPTTEDERAAYNRMVNARTQWRAAAVVDELYDQYGTQGRYGALDANGMAAKWNRVMDGWSESQMYGVQQAVYNRILSCENGSGRIRDEVQVHPGGVTQYGRTLYDIASHPQTWYNGAEWQTIYNDPANKAIWDKYGITDPADFYKISGEEVLVINYNKNLKSKDELHEEYFKALQEYNAIKNGKHKTQQEYDSIKHRFYDNTLSELTDALIPEIPQEFIIGFTLTSTDKNIYNAYEVNIEADFGLYEGNNTGITRLSRVFADIPSFIRFGVRQCPQVYNFPYMGNKENAHLLGFMLCARSLAQRNSATLTMIEDSFIHVGDPIRFFAYDEHPAKPLASQENVAGSALGLGEADSALNVMGRGGYTLSEATGIVNGGPLSHSADPRPKQVTETPGARGDSQTGTRQSGAQTTLQAGEIPKGSAMNITTGKWGNGSSYSGLRASDAAMQTRAQSIYYVEAVQRQINPSDKSQMTVNLSCGRMMGMPSVVDYMLLLYKAYYDANTGFAPDMDDINTIRKAYQGATESFDIDAGTTFADIAKHFGIDLDAPQKVPTEPEPEPPSLYDVATTTLPLCEAHDLAQGAGWKLFTGKMTGTIWRSIGGQPQQIATCTYFVYDGTAGQRAVFHLDGASGDWEQQILSAAGAGSSKCALCSGGASGHARTMLDKLKTRTRDRA